MAHLWRISEAGEWLPCALAGELFALPHSGPPPSLAAIDRDAELDAVALRRAVGSSDDAWLLLAAPDARVLINGLPIPHGIVLLSDRDEIRLPPAPGCAAGRLFFSIERLAVVEAYPADGRRGACPRCKQALAAGDAAVRCPGCGLWHHATEALPCWTYAEHCAACAQLTSLDTGFQWTPEDL